MSPVSWVSKTVSGQAPRRLLGRSAASSRGLPIDYPDYGVFGVLVLQGVWQPCQDFSKQIRLRLRVRLRDISDENHHDDAVLAQNKDLFTVQEAGSQAQEEALAGSLDRGRLRDDALFAGIVVAHQDCGDAWRAC